MTRFFANTILLCLGILTLVNSLVAAGKKTTVKEYFFLLPNEAMPFTFKSLEERKNFLVVPKAGDKSSLNQLYTVTKVIDDPKNGYLEVQYSSDFGPASTSLAIWRTDAGDDVIGIVDQAEESTRAVPKFYSMVKGSWKDVTGEVFAAFQKNLFRPRDKWPERCAEIGEAAAEKEFPDGMHCPLPQKGLDITCTYKFKCMIKTPVSVYAGDSVYSAKDYYANTKVKFRWSKNKFVAP